MLSFTIVMLLSAVGFALSYYVYTIEQNISVNPAYKPLCDISDRVSCSKPITTGYGRLLGISNAIVGMVSYATLFLFALLGYSMLISIALLCALAVTPMLMYLLYVKIKSLCLICTAVYGINIALCVVWFLL